LVCSNLHQILKAATRLDEARQQAKLHDAEIRIGVTASIAIACARVTGGSQDSGANVGVSARANAVGL
jgi:hypothetical protein